MFCIIEGGDGVGKSTLADAVAETIRNKFIEFGDKVELLHRSQLKRDPFDEYAFDVDDYRPGVDQVRRHIVADRWHWGELVYAQLYRGAGPYGALGEDGFRWVELYLKSRGAMVWHVDLDADRIRTRFDERGEDYLQPEHLEWCLNRYREICSDSALYFATIFNTAAAEMRELVDMIVMEHKLRDQRMQRFNAFPGYVGGDVIHTLLVGEKHGGKPPHKSEAAFIPTGSNSSSFLLTALPDPFWKDVGLVNALETDVRALIMALDYKPSVVALGHTASQALDEMDIDHAAVVHPQFARRFLSRRKEAYGALIEEVAGTDRKEFSWR